MSDVAADLIGREKTFGARNYDPLPVVLARGEGSWLADVDGRRYLDLMSAYSAVSYGHAHPRIVGALVAQAQQLGVTSRAFHNDQLPLFFERLTRIDGARPRAAGERRRRSGRDRAQGGAQMGSQGQGHSRWPGRDHRVPRQLPRPLDHDRRVLDRSAISRRLRTVRAGIRDHSLWRRGRAGEARSRPTRRRSSSSRSRARRASSCRRRVISRECARSAATTACS